jgi:hypothetical protein
MHEIGWDVRVNLESFEIYPHEIKLCDNNSELWLLLCWSFEFHLIAKFNFQLSSIVLDETFRFKLLFANFSLFRLAEVA